MAERTVYVCDVCGTEKQQGNHWWAIVIVQRGRSPLLQVAELGSLVAASENDTLFHLCGDACVIRKVNEFLGAKTK